MKQRIEWIDIAKFFGMFFIYIGHFGESAGLAYVWVFSFHVPLFFFLSGCTENFNTRKTAENILRLIKTLLIPFLFFAILSLIFAVLQHNSPGIIVADLVSLLNGGIRNHIAVNGTLWFLTCLFVVEVIFSLLKLLKNKWFIAVFCLIIYCFANLGFDPTPLSDPRWFMNIDSAFCYLLYYCLGWLMFPFLCKMFHSGKSSIKIVVALETAVCFIYSAFVFFGVGITGICYSIHPLLGIAFNVFETIILINFILGISFYLSKCSFLRKLGQDSLYLCGNEYLVKESVPLLLSLIGLQLTLSNPIQVFFYSFGLMVLVHFFLAPWQNQLLQSIINLPKRLFSEKVKN